jgi:hypothetical protein
VLVEFGGDPVEFGADRVRVAGAGVVQYGLEPAPVLGDGGVLAAQPADDRGEAGELGLQAGEGASFLVVVVLAEDAADGDAVFAQLPGRVGGGAGPAAQSGGVDAAVVSAAKKIKVPRSWRPSTSRRGTCRCRPTCCSTGR